MSEMNKEWLSEADALLDVESMTQEIETELIEMLQISSQPPERIKANIAHALRVVETYLAHPFPDNSEDRIYFHIRKKILLKFLGVYQHFKSDERPFYFERRGIARGGLEAEYIIATENDSGTPLAVKILRSGVNEGVKQCFANEQAVLRKLNKVYPHNYPPNLIRLHATGDGVTATERVPGGKSLESLIEADNLDFNLVLNWISDLAMGLESLYAAGFESHNDVSPQNCIVGDDMRLVVCDLSMVIRRPVESKTSHMHAGGRYEYMAPERFIAYVANGKQSTIDRRSDVFSLAVIVHRLFTNGRDPFNRDHMKPDEIGTGFYYAVAASAKVIYDHDLLVVDTQGVPVNRNLLKNFAENNGLKTLESHGCPFDLPEEVLHEIDLLLYSCFQFDLSKRPLSPMDFFNKLAVILQRNFAAQSP